MSDTYNFTFHPYFLECNKEIILWTEAYLKTNVFLRFWQIIAKNIVEKITSGQALREFQVPLNLHLDRIVARQAGGSVSMPVSILKILLAEFNQIDEMEIIKWAFEGAFF